MPAMFWLWDLIAGFALGGTAAELGADSFADREVASATIRSAGVWAWPTLERAAGSPDPEIARRAARLCQRWRDVRLDLEALWVLAAPHDPDAVAMFGDHALRVRLARLGLSVESPHALWMHPDSDDGDIVAMWFRERPPHHYLAVGLANARSTVHPCWFVAPAPRAK